MKPGHNVSPVPQQATLSAPHTRTRMDTLICQRGCYFGVRLCTCARVRVSLCTMCVCVDVQLCVRARATALALNVSDGHSKKKKKT